MSLGAILVAAGQGTRLGADRPKALVLLEGEPLVRHAVRGLLAAAEPPTALVLVAPPGYEEQVQDAVAELRPGGGGPRVEVVAGGAERPDSVLRGLRRLPPEVDRVLVHDAARAATPPSVIDAVTSALAAGHRAVVPALPVTDTVKQVAAGPGDGVAVGRRGRPDLEVPLERVETTLDRSRLRAVQTPQGFDRTLLERAHAHWAGGSPATDDAGMVEALGEPVVLVPGDPRGAKITTPPDLALVRALRAETAAGASDDAALPSEAGPRPVLLVLGGLPGTGKTTLARAWARRRGAAHVRVDTLEQTLLAAAAGPADPVAGAGGADDRPLLGPEGYQLGYAVAADQLALGLDVVADSVNPLPVTRQAWREVAARAGARLVEVELVLQDEQEHRRRVMSRQADIAGHRLPTWHDTVGREYAPWEGASRLEAGAPPERLLSDLQEVTG